MTEIQTQRQVYRKAYNKRIKQETITHYGGICACCGESTIEFLAIDHIDGQGNIARRNNSKYASGGVPYYQKLKREGYPQGYRVLCHNCNQSFGAWGYCPHQTQKEKHIVN